MAAIDNCGIEPGRLVSSKAGRDRGRYYLIYEVLSDRFVRVVDGRIRRIENPKPKNVKHLCFHPKVAEEIAAKLKQGERVTNAEIREALERLISQS